MKLNEAQRAESETRAERVQQLLSALGQETRDQLDLIDSAIDHKERPCDCSGCRDVAVLCGITEALATNCNALVRDDRAVIESGLTVDGKTIVVRGLVRGFYSAMRFLGLTTQDMVRHLAIEAASEATGVAINVSNLYRPSGLAGMDPEGHG